MKKAEPLHYSSTRFFRWIVAGVALLVAMACDRSETELFGLDLGYDYFPLELGQRRTYQLDSIVFDPQGNGIRIDTFSSLIRETVVDTFRDGSGLLNYRIERERRAGAGQSWQPAGVFAEARDQRRAYRQEGNFRYWKLAFPPSVSSRWDPTAFFDNSQTVAIAGERLEFFKGWEGSYTAIDQPYELGDRPFERTLQVRLSDFENLIELRKASEVYAAGIGLIFREWQVIDTQCRFCCGQDFARCESLPWPEKAERGAIIRMQWID